jgi:nicotinate-nucleotide--dimethylbenzimidazole phosphoribosyltransferase
MPLSLPEIQRPDPQLRPPLQRRLDNLTKPPGSLGRLEEFACEFGVMRGSTDLVLNKQAIFTFAADHGVSRDGVSAYPREVTAQMVFNFLRGGAAINVLCRHYGIENIVVDVGVDYDFQDLSALVSKKVRRGTENLAERPAMTEADAIRAIQAGMDCAQGYDLIGTGDMGIGNTTPSSAILAVIAGLPVEDVVGRGTGVDEERMRHKTNLIKDAIRRHQPDPHDALDVLTKIGGLEIGAIAGLIIGAAARRIPVVVDGFISGAGAMIATKLAPESRAYIFFSHLSRERGHRRMMEFLDARPILDLDMCLGEGTGAAVAMDIITASVRIYQEMATFESASVSQSHL